MKKQNKKLITTLVALVFLSQGVSAANISRNIELTSGQMQSVREALRDKSEFISKNEEKIKEIEEELAPLRERISTLGGQLQNLDYLIKLSRTKIKNVEEQIEMKELELGDVMEKKDMFLSQYNDQKESLNNYARVLYRIESQFFDFKTGKINPIKLLLAQGAVSDTARSVNYLTVAQKTEKVMIDRLVITQERVSLQEQRINKTRRELAGLKGELEGEKANLDAQIKAKGNLLQLTQGQEKAYQDLLAEALAQQQEVEDDIANLKGDYTYLAKKLDLLEREKNRPKNTTSDFNVYQSPVSYNDLDAINNLLDPKHQSFMWPVDPTRGITAYFKDSGYKAHFGVPHYAIDLRAYQGTAIAAPADGIVYKVKDNGYGYSYLIVAHRDNLLTVYGHVLEFLVEEGDTVYQGEAIALSGGMPGTPGAGPMTTGPHLHFEVYDNGTHVDPLDYLPVFELPDEYIPEKYLDRLSEIDIDTLLNIEKEKVENKEEKEEEDISESAEEVNIESEEEEEEVLDDAASGMGVD